MRFQLTATTAKNIRSLALDVLLKWQQQHIFIESSIEQHHKKYNLSPRDRGFLQAITAGVLRHQRRWDFLLQQLQHKKNTDPLINTLLQIGLCQLFLLEVPAYAAVDKTVAVAAKKYRAFINAILRNAIRKKKQLEQSLSKQSLAVQYSHPDWLVTRWQEQFGTAITTNLLQHNNRIPHNYLRRNTLIDLPVEYQKIWHDIAGNPCSQYADFYRIKGAVPQQLLDLGCVYMQDPSTQTAIDLLAPQAGQKILDCCAAPGGKSSAIVARANNQVELVCCDVNMSKMTLLADNLKKLGMQSAQTMQHDWTTKPPMQWQQAFDGIIVDVPCSNTGVMQRRIETRWRLTPADITALLQTQYTILQHASLCLRVGGRLVYSTCSIDKAENQQLIADFLVENNQFKLAAEKILLPDSDHHDGAYAALIEYNK